MVALNLVSSSCSYEVRCTVHDSITAVLCALLTLAALYVNEIMS
jgi:hypothetical protein